MIDRAGVEAVRAEADLRLDEIRRAGVGGHDQDHVPEIGFDALAVRDRCVVHHLQEHIQDVRVRLFHFVKQQHAVRILADDIGQAAAFFVAHVAGRRPEEFGDGMLLHVFAHVETQERDPHGLRQHARDLRLAHTGRPDKKKARDRLVIFVEARAGKPDRAAHGVHRLILPVDFRFDPLRQIAQLRQFVRGHGLARDAQELRQDRLQQLLRDDLLLAVAVQVQIRAGFVHQIDRLVRLKDLGAVLAA